MRKPLLLTLGVLTNGTNKEIDLDAAKGTYLLQIKTVEGVVSRRIQVQ